MSEHLDSAILSSLQEIMGEEYPVLLDTFLADSEERVRLLREALGQSDAQALRQAAHSFKGSCSNMGAPLLAGLCRLLEEAGRRGQLDGCEAQLEHLERELAIVRIMFRSERQRFVIGRS